MDHQIPDQFEERGIIHGGTVTPESLKAASEWPLASKDVIVTAYPKSGTTWTKYVTYLILYPDVVENPPQDGSIHADVGYIEFMFPLTETMAKPPPRLFCTHLEYQRLRGYVEDKKVKVIHIRREIKDVLNSYYNFYKMNTHLGKFTGTFDDFFSLFENKRLQYGDPVVHNQEWWDARDNANILYLTYEEMQKDVVGTIKKIASFLGRDLSEEIIHKIAQLSSFDSMKANRHTNCSQVAERGVFDFSISAFLRKGKVGDYKEQFNKYQEAWVEKRLNETTVPYG